MTWLLLSTNLSQYSLTTCDLHFSDTFWSAGRVYTIAIILGFRNYFTFLIFPSFRFRSDFHLGFFVIAIKHEFHGISISLPYQIYGTAYQVQAVASWNMQNGRSMIARDILVKCTGRGNVHPSALVYLSWAVYLALKTYIVVCCFG